MPRFTLVVRANDPNRYVSPSWLMDVASGADNDAIWRAADNVAQRENVTVVKIIRNSNAKEVPRAVKSS